jgi:hypothetical protein
MLRPMELSLRLSRLSKSLHFLWEIIFYFMLWKGFELWTRTG